MTDENTTEQEQPEQQGQRFSLGLTPFGGIGVNIADASGNQASYLIMDPDEVGKIVMHLTALAVMMIQARYAQAMQEQEMANQILKKDPVWTPGGK